MSKVSVLRQLNACTTILFRTSPLHRDGVALQDREGLVKGDSDFASTPDRLDFFLMTLDVDCSPKVSSQIYFHQTDCL